VAVTLGVGIVSAHAAVPSLEVCREAIDENPKNPAVYYCVYRSVLAHGHTREAASMLERYRRANPDVPRIGMLLVWIDRMLGKPETEARLREVVDAMEAAGDYWGVVYGGLDLADRLGARGEIDGTAALLARCEAAAKATGDRTMEARVWVQRGIQAEREGDYSVALHLTRRARRVVSPGGPYDLRCAVVNLLGTVYWSLCRYTEALQAFEDEAVIREQANDRWWGAVAAYNVALCAIRMVQSGEMSREKARDLLETAQRMAVEVGNAENAAELLVMLGSERGGEEGLRLVRKGARTLSHLDEPVRVAQAVRAEGVVLVEMGSRHDGLAARRFAEAGRLAREGGASDVATEVMVSRARLAALSGTPEETLRMGLAVLDAIERLRTPQVSGSVRAQSFVRWAPAYYRLAGFLLQRAVPGEQGADDRALAFEVMERFRARELLENIALRDGGLGDAVGPTARRHRAALETISAIQRRLSDPGLQGSLRERTLQRLVRAEEHEAALRDAVSRQMKEADGRAAAGAALLDEVRAALDPGEALLVYQLWDGEPWARRPVAMGRSWLLVVTREGTRAVALASRHDLRARTAIFEGSILSRRGERSTAVVRAAARLYDDLLREAIDGLPSGVRSLVIVPDDVLFGCPFAALRDGPSGPPVGCRFGISIVPSAGVWATLRRRRKIPGRDDAAGALILAAPEAGAEDPGTGAVRSANPWKEGLRLAPLPGAEREARALERVAGRRTVLLRGDAASEAAFKRMRLDQFRVIDLVTHAVVDDSQPERSAIVLVAGDSLEDGLLQVREIPDLALNGQLVILSSCGSSSGELLAGEGARSLARAFLEAGASAVLASLWPLRDTEAAVLFASVARELGRGSGVSEALRVAQAEAMDGGMPEAGWAGIVVVGDGSLQPFRGRSRWPGVWLPAASAGCVLLVAVVLAVRRLRGGGRRR